MLRAITLVLSLLPASALAQAQSPIINLTCGGSFKQHIPEYIDGVVPAASAQIDRNLQKVTTPVGDFRLVRESDTTFVFESLSKAPYGLGNLDRTTGRMQVQWFLNFEEYQRLVRGETVKGKMFADLTCSVARRLF